MSRPRKTLRQAFVLTVAFAGVASLQACDTVVTFADCPADAPAAGSTCGAEGTECSYTEPSCGTTFTATCGDEGWEVIAPDIACNPPFPEPPDVPCPADVPASGGACSSVGQLCEYGYGDICEEWYAGATCTPQGWEVEEWWSGGECNPPPAECPDELPLEGEACPYDPNSWDGYPSYCMWSTESPCGSQFIEGSCVPDEVGTMVWELTAEFSCNTTPELCADYDTEIGCGTDDACQWLEPSCNDFGINVKPGCYAAGDCTTAGCGDWGTCSKVSYDPCHNAACQACAADIDVCIPNEL